MRIERMTTALLLLLFPGAALAQPTPLGPEFQVNTYTTSQQDFPSVAIDGSGDFVVVWESYPQDGSGNGVFGQRFDSAGAPLGSEFQVNTYTTGRQDTASVAVDGSGRFVVVWESRGQDGQGQGVFGQRFDSAGAPLGGEFQVNTYTSLDQFGPRVAFDGSGNFVVAWASQHQDGDGGGIFARRYDSAGATLGAEFQVNTYTTAYQLYPSIALRAPGDFVVTWTSQGQDGSGDGIFAQRFDSSGAPVGSEFQVNTFTTSSQRHSAVAIDGSGRFLIVWNGDVEDGDSFGIFGQRYDSSGAPAGGEFQINTYTTYTQYLPRVGVDGSGNFVVVWESYYEDGDRIGVFGRRFGSGGAPLGGEFQASTFTTSYQRAPSVAVDSSGSFVVAWSSYTQDGSHYGIFAQRYCADTDGDGLCDGQDVVVTAPAAGSVVDCSSPSIVRPTFAWDAGDFDKFKVFIATSPAFGAGTLSSGDRFFTATTYTPPPKKWKSACRKALAANPSSPVLFIEVQGVDTHVPRSDPERKTFSQVVQVGVQ